MNNEPVAWRCNKFYENQEGWFYNENEIGEPLYTHPAELTDEEIGQIWKDCMESPYMQVSNPVGFARAVLRKAQEK